MLGYFKTYFTVTSALVLSVGAVNLTADPLWYANGNKLNMVNMVLNERVTKTNLLLNSDQKKYDCLIFGSSRLTLLNSKSLHKNICFNYAFSAGTAEEFTKYAEYAKKKGINPKKVYVGIDAFNFTFDKKTAFKDKVEVAEPKPIYQSYLFSADTLMFSFDTITGRSSEARFYDQDFQGKVFETVPKYKPKFSEQKSNEKCDFSRIPYYKQMRTIFPDAEIIGYVAPISVWKVYNDSYARGLLDCQLQGIYEASKNFTQAYDFSYVSELTTRTDNTYDGSHYYPNVHNKIAKILEGEQSSLGIRIHEYSLTEYQQFHKSKLQEFIQKQGKGR